MSEPFTGDLPSEDDFPSDHVLDRPFHRRRPLRADVQRAHARVLERLGDVDSSIEELLDVRRACLADLAPLRRALNRRWTHHHVRRRAGVDEAPMPPAPSHAEAIDGIDLRAVCLTLLRRHGTQDLRALHGLLHCYGYTVAGVRPVQRLGDAMAYEVRCGRMERVARGVYAAAGEDQVRRARYGEAPECGQPLPWSRPVTDPGPPLVDPPVAQDPELWSGGAWPSPPTLAGPDIPDGTEGPQFAGRSDGAGTEDDGAEEPTSRDPRPEDRTPPATALGDDSSTNRPRAPGDVDGPGDPGGVRPGAEAPLDAGSPRRRSRSRRRSRRRTFPRRRPRP